MASQLHGTGGKQGAVRGVRKPHDKWFTTDSSLKMEIVDKQRNVCACLRKWPCLFASVTHARVSISPHCLRTMTSPYKSHQVFVALALRRVTFGATERQLSLLINGNLHYSTWVFSFMALPSPFPDCGYDLLWKAVLKGQVYFLSFHNKPSGKAFEHLRLPFKFRPIRAGAGLQILTSNTWDKSCLWSVSLVLYHAILSHDFMCF